jgi:hypothetical protein
MSVTGASDVYPRKIVSGQTIRLIDKSSSSGEVITNYVWYDAYALTWAPNATSTNIYIATASSYFAVNQQCVFRCATSFPTGITAHAWAASLSIVYWVIEVTSTYIRVSATKGGAALSYTSNGSGAQYCTPASSYKNGLLRPLPLGARSVPIYLYVTGSNGGTASATLALPAIAAPSTAKPTSPLYGRATIFIYDSTDATAINRRKATGNPFFFQKLKVTGSMNKAGTAKFTVVDMGGATATEKGLIVADKNVAIILGHNVIWSGKILRAVQGKMSLYDVASPFSSWSVECESDISKMKNQPVKAANQLTYNLPVGMIVNKLVENSAATDVDWRGVVETSLISFEGPNLLYEITSEDMYSQLMTLASASGFDWRTRNNYVKCLYGASGYSAASKTVTVADITPYTASSTPATSFLNRWLLFTNDTNADASSNTDGVRAYGKITSNTTTVLTMTTINNSSIPPASSGNVIILGGPVLDFTSDLRQYDYQCTFTANKTRAAGLQNAYEMNDKSDFKNIVTKIIVKGKNLYSGKTETVSFGAVTEWIPAEERFDHSTFVTQKTMGYAHSTDGTYLYLRGWGWALPTDNDPYINLTHADSGGTFYYGYIVASTEVIRSGEKVTRVETYVDWAEPVLPGDTVYVSWAPTGGSDCMPIFVNSFTDIGGGASTTINVRVGDFSYYASLGTLKAGTHAVFGNYINLRAQYGSDITIHYPGCIVWNTSSYSETSPEATSPMAYFGHLEKSFALDQSVSKGDLEVYASKYLINLSQYYKKGGFWSIFYDWFKTDMRPANQVTEAGWISVGDLVAVLQNTGDTVTDVQYGLYKNQWQILSWTLDGDKMSVSCELGDFEMNMNSLINDKTAGVNSTIT